VVDWLGAIITLVVGMLVGMIVFQSPSLAYIAWLWFMIPWLWLRTHDPAHFAYAFVVNLIFLIATLPEIRMIMQYRREDKYEAYMQGLIESSPRWRAMRKIADRLTLLRK
jgi:hypothetical protein